LNGCANGYERVIRPARAYMIFIFFGDANIPNLYVSRSGAISNLYVRQINLKMSSIMVLVMRCAL
jgi:hypothetical protein